MNRAAARVLALCVSLVAISCSDAVAEVRDANALFAAGRYESALDWYRELQRQHPDWPQLAVNAGNALHMLGEHERALTNYEVALLAADRRIAAISHYDRGNTLFRLERYDEARAAYVEALRLDPTDRDAKFNIEVIDRLRGQDGATDSQPGGDQQPGEGSGDPGEQPPSDGSGSTPGGASEEPPGGESSTRAPADVGRAVEEFRDSLTPEEALRLLDALLAEQRGISVLADGSGQRPGETRY